MHNKFTIYTINIVVQILNLARLVLLNQQKFAMFCNDESRKYKFFVLVVREKMKMIEKIKKWWNEHYQGIYLGWPPAINFGKKKLEGMVEKTNVTYNENTKNIHIGTVDRSTNITYSNDLGLSPDAILSLPSKKIGDLFKQQTILNLEAAYKDKPKEMEKYFKKYNPYALTVGATNLTARVYVTHSSQGIEKSNPMPSGDFIEKLPQIIEKTLRETIHIKDTVDIEIINKNQNNNT